MQCVSSRRKISVKEEKEKGDTKGGGGVRVSLVWAKLGLSRSAGQIKTAITRRMVR